MKLFGQPEYLEGGGDVARRCDDQFDAMSAGESVGVDEGVDPGRVEERHQRHVEVRGGMRVDDELTERRDQFVTDGEVDLAGDREHWSASEVVPAELRELHRSILRVRRDEPTVASEQSPRIRTPMLAGLLNRTKSLSRCK